MAAKVDISIAAYHERTGTTTRPAGSATSITRHKPHGVLAVFGPYNFPGHLPNGHIVPALLAGNTVVFKPSELTPMVGEKLMRIWESAAFRPASSTSSREPRTRTGACDDEGSTDCCSPAAPPWVRFSTSNIGGHPEKMLALEMGGNNPLIFVDATDIDAAVANTIESAFVTSGQRCTCARRLMVPLTERGDQFLDCWSKRRHASRWATQPVTSSWVR